MIRKILLLSVTTAVVTSLQAQKSGKKTGTTTGYAITASEKGGRAWREVRMVDVSTGAELKTIYSSQQTSEPLNARTGKAVVKKDKPANSNATVYVTSFDGNNGKDVQVKKLLIDGSKKVVDLDQVLDNTPGKRTVNFTRTVVINRQANTDQPFATNSAAMAYDKKHDRLYYTPMGVNQLRYIDLKSGQIYYFEDEAFGAVKHMGDVSNQITRMVIGSDGNGYALSNDANHLVRFTTGKNPVITDLGAVTDDAANAKLSIHANHLFGGDMIADASGHLYLITANRNVFRIDIESRVASYTGVIKGLPQGFSSNGAMVEEGSKVIIASSESTVGYYRFDLVTLEAEKISTSADVFNASDLANGNLAFDKKKKSRKTDEPAPTANTVAAETAKGAGAGDQAARSGISVYPNPVTDGVVRLAFNGQPAGRYRIQLLDLSGRIITSKEVRINSASQIEELRFPELSVKGNYLVRISNESGNLDVTNKLVVQ